MSFQGGNLLPGVTQAGQDLFGVRAQGRGRCAERGGSSSPNWTGTRGTTRSSPFSSVTRVR